MLLEPLGLVSVQNFSNLSTLLQVARHLERSSENPSIFLQT